MTPLAWWFWMMVGGLIYQAVRAACGLSPTWETNIDAAYWLGTAAFSAHFGLLRS